MKFSLDADVIFEIEGCVEAVAVELVGTVVRRGNVEHGADLQDSGGRCGGVRLGM